jgi:hypothetical protein
MQNEDAAGPRYDENIRLWNRKAMKTRQPGQSTATLYGTNKTRNSTEIPRWGGRLFYRFTCINEGENVIYCRIWSSIRLPKKHLFHLFHK